MINKNLIKVGRISQRVRLGALLNQLWAFLTDSEDGTSLAITTDSEDGTPQLILIDMEDR